MDMDGERTGERFVVPRLPGPLVGLTSGRARDEVDDVLDALLPDTDEGPGRVDILLLGGGAVGIAVGAVTGIGGVVVAGVAGVVVGAILPLRAVFRGLRGRGTSGRPSLLLDTADKGVARLVRDHGELLAVPQVSDEVVSVAHQAVTETAAFLDDGLPRTTAEHDFVNDRVAALEHLLAVEAAARERRAAARRELDELDPTSAPARAKRLADGG